MKKIKTIVFGLVRNVILVVPGVVAAWLLVSLTSTLIAILAAVGVESIFLLLVGIAVAVSDSKKAMQDDDVFDDL